MKDPSDKYGSFEESGYRFTAYLPSTSEERHAWRVVVENGSEVVRVEYIDLMYPCHLGPDVLDVQKLEESVDSLIEEMAEDAAQ